MCNSQCSSCLRHIWRSVFLSPADCRRQPRGQGFLAVVLLIAVAIVVFGSLIGEYASIRGWFGKSWYWIGDQGWEYLDLGRLWQTLLVIGLVLWVILFCRVAAVLRQPFSKLQHFRCHTPAHFREASMGHLGHIKNEYRAFVRRLEATEAALPEPRDPRAWAGWKEILEILLTPEEADLAARLPLGASGLDAIAARVGRMVKVFVIWR